jgi:hypothetical protein
MSGPGPDDESPPDEQRRLTPAERAGATPLDPERFKLNAGMPVGQRNRELLGLAPGGDASAEPVEPVVRRRRSTSRSSARRGTARPWLIGAAAVGLLAAMLLVAGVVVEEDVAVAAAAPPELVAVTPVLSVLACGYILASLHWYTWLAFGAWVSVVLTFYFTWGRHNSALNKEALNQRALNKQALGQETPKDPL